MSSETQVEEGSGTPADPYIITDVDELQGIQDELSAHYALGNDIDASVTQEWNEGAGFEPIGDVDDDSSFTGTFDGRGHVIDGLYIDRAGTSGVGLFGNVGSRGVVENVGLEGVDVTGEDYVGALVGLSDAGRNPGWTKLSNSYSTGTVTGGGGVGKIGGLVGSTTGRTSGSYSTATVSGDTEVGGLAGNSSYTVAGCHSTGDVSGDSDVGGLVGAGSATISNSYSTGDVNGGTNVGGLLGTGGESVIDSYSTGTVTGTDRVGGLLGSNDSELSGSYSTSTVDGNEQVGGLVGRNGYRVSDSYATGDVTGDVEVGGLIGDNGSSGSVSRSYSTGTVTGTEKVGGLIGEDFGVVEDSFWDTETSGQETSAGGTGKSTGEMMDVATYTDTATEGLSDPWDVVLLGNHVAETWYIDDGNDYPRQRWEQVSGAITDWYDLHAVRNDPSGDYVLKNDLTAETSGYLDYNADNTAGWSPIGDGSVPFTGSFDGQGHVIEGLSIERGNTDTVGLFGKVGAGGVVKNLGIEDAEIVGNNDTGSLTGRSQGHVTDAHSTGSVTGNSGVSVGGLVGVVLVFGSVSDSHSAATVSGDGRVGGLIGEMDDGRLSDSYATGTVTGNDAVGGLVGSGDGVVSDSYSTARVTGESELDNGVGGLIGSNSADVSDSHSTGDVTGNGNEVGGLIGGNSGSVSASYSTSNVSGDIQTGGLVGENQGNVSTSYSTGTVDGTENVGGLVGWNNGNVSNSYSTSGVTGETSVGGLVGENQNSVSNSYSTGTVTGTGDVGGLIGEDDGGVATDSFWDTETSGTDESAGGTGKPTSQMMDTDTFHSGGWDIVLLTDHDGETWYIDDGSDYPRFGWEPKDLVPSITGDTIESGGQAEISVEANEVNTISIADLWLDWVVVDVQDDGAEFTDSVDTTGSCEFVWDATNASVVVSITLDIPNRYAGGTYVFEATATVPDDSAQSTGTIEIT